MNRTRREFVAGAGTVVFGSSLIGGTAAADANATVPRVSTFGHFDDDARLTGGNTTTNYDTSGDVPGIDAPPVGDLTVFVHGWRATQDDEEARADNDAKFAQADHELVQSGYDGTVIGYEWDAHRGDSPDFGWADANRIAERNGPKLARFVREYHASRPSSSIRIASHSLGTLVLVRCLEELDGSGDWARGEPGIATIHPFGAAVDHDRPTSAYSATKRAVETQVASAHNYHSRKDSVLAAAYEPREVARALGRHGADPDREPATNYADHDVTDAVGADHSGYLENVSDLIVSHMA
ncbi:MAG: alpha/beta hydrolase [Halalkalicoccus sp.]